MNRTPSGMIYFFMCLLCRGVSGIGASMGLSYAIVGYFFPNRIASVVALLEVCTGIGLMTGPVLGGFLYQIGLEINYILLKLVTKKLFFFYQTKWISIAVFLYGWPSVCPVCSSIFSLSKP